MIFAASFNGLLAFLALFPAPIFAQSGDLNSLILVLSRFEDLSIFTALITVTFTDRTKIFIWTGVDELLTYGQEIPRYLEKCP